MKTGISYKKGPYFQYLGEFKPEKGPNLEKMTILIGISYENRGVYEKSTLIALFNRCFK
jgi:hypothetical protein